MRISYVNGRYVRHDLATVHIEDRGYQFSDGMYEYIAFYNGVLLDGDAHFKRLERSLAELSIAPPMHTRAMKLVVRELIARNYKKDGGLYIQISRGVAKRDHAYPKHTTGSSLVMTVCGPKFPKPHEFAKGVKIISQPDLRWKRRDIKSISLLANVMARQAAAEQGAREAWLIDDGVITEGALSNGYIITKEGVLVTQPNGNHILPGVTRDVVIGLAKALQIRVEERGFTLDEAYGAAEAFVTSTSANVLPVVQIDDKIIGSGIPGEYTVRLLGAYNEHIYTQTGKRFS